MHLIHLEDKHTDHHLDNDIQEEQEEGDGDGDDYVNDVDNVDNVDNAIEEDQQERDDDGDNNGLAAPSQHGGTFSVMIDNGGQLSVTKSYQSNKICELCKDYMEYYINQGSD